MIYKINFIVPEDVQSDDAIAAFGWLSIESRGIKIGLFEDKYCMIIPTAMNLMTNLSRVLRDESKTFDLLAIDYGAVIIFEKKGEDVILKTPKFSIAFDLIEFAKCVAIGSYDLWSTIETTVSSDQKKKLSNFKSCCDIFSNALDDALKSSKKRQK